MVTTSRDARFVIADIAARIGRLVTQKVSEAIVYIGSKEKFNGSKLRYEPLYDRSVVDG